MARELKVRPDGQTVNVTLDASVVAQLDEVSEKLSESLGFRVSPSNAVRHLIKRFNNEKLVDKDVDRRRRL